MSGEKRDETYDELALNFKAKIFKCMLQTYSLVKLHMDGCFCRVSSSTLTDNKEIRLIMHGVVSLCLVSRAVHPGPGAGPIGLNRLRLEK